MWNLVKCGITIPQFSKIAAFDIESLKKRVPKAPLAHHFRADLDDITSSRKKRLDWLTCRGKEQERERERQRKSKFMAKPAGSAIHNAWLCCQVWLLT